MRCYTKTRVFSLRLGTEEYNQAHILYCRLVHAKVIKLDRSFSSFLRELFTLGLTHVAEIYPTLEQENETWTLAKNCKRKR